MGQFILLTFIGLVSVASVLSVASPATRSSRNEYYDRNYVKGPERQGLSRPMRPTYYEPERPYHFTPNRPTYNEPEYPGYYGPKRQDRFTPNRPTYHGPEYPGYNGPQYQPHYPEQNDYNEFYKSFQYIFSKLKDISLDIHRIPQKVKDVLDMMPDEPSKPDETAVR